MTRQEFDTQMARMFSLDFPPHDTDTLWDVLQDVPDDVLRAAVGHACRTRDKFPTPNQLRQDADIVAARVRTLPPDEDRGVDLGEPLKIAVPVAGLMIPVTREWRYYHEPCGDSGMESVWCGDSYTRNDAGDRVAHPQFKPWYTLGQCAKSKAHEPHEWVRRCICWDSNPALERKREAQRKFADDSQTKHKAGTR